MIWKSLETFIPPETVGLGEKNNSVFAFHNVGTLLSKNYEQKIYITISNQFRNRKQFFLHATKFSLAQLKGGKLAPWFMHKIFDLGFCDAKQSFKLDLFKLAQNCF